MHDWGSRDPAFIDLNKRVRAHLLRIAEADPATHVAALVQGSGTFAVEATIGTLVPRNGERPLPLSSSARLTRSRRELKARRREGAKARRREGAAGEERIADWDSDGGSAYETA